MIRSLLSVLAGFVVMAVLVSLATVVAVKTMLHVSDLRTAMNERPTPAYLAVNVIYSALFAAVGGYVTASIAGRAPLLHAAALAALMFVMSLVSFCKSAGTSQPPWYGVTLMLLAPTAALLGGYMKWTRGVA